MHLTYSHCGDVHKKSIVACCLVSTSGKPIRKRALTAPIHANYWQWRLVQPARRHHVAMESTGEYWKPVYNLLEDRFEVLVVNAHHLKQVPGRKTDVKDGVDRASSVIVAR